MELKIIKDKRENIDIYTDGGSRGNPGDAAIGIIMLERDIMFYQYGEFIGKATNNQAEYMAVIKALEIARGVGCTEANVYSDSLLMIRQLKGQYKVRNDKLLELYYKVKVLEESFKNIKYEHVIRDNIYIRQADKLVNGILDKFAKKTVKPNNILYYTERSKT